MILKKKHLNLRSEAVVYLPCFTFDFKENSKEMAADWQPCKHPNTRQQASSDEMHLTLSTRLAEIATSVTRLCALARGQSPRMSSIFVGTNESDFCGQLHNFLKIWILKWTAGSDYSVASTRRSRDLGEMLHSWRVCCPHCFDQTELSPQTTDIPHFNFF